MSTWNIKGVSAEAREVVKTLSNQAGQTAGQWVEGVIRYRHQFERHNQIKTQLKILLQLAERHNQLQQEFDHRTTWLKDRLAKIREDLNQWQNRNNHPVNVPLPINVIHAGSSEQTEAPSEVISPQPEVVEHAMVCVTQGSPNKSHNEGPASLPVHETVTTDSEVREDGEKNEIGLSYHTETKGPSVREMDNLSPAVHPHMDNVAFSRAIPTPRKSSFITKAAYGTGVILLWLLLTGGVVGMMASDQVQDLITKFMLKG